VPKVWIAGPDDAEAVIRLLTGFRDHLGYDWPGDDSFARNVRRLLTDEQTEYLLAAPRDGDAPHAVCQLRFRLGIWRDGGDCLVEDVFVEGSSRGAGLGRALLEAARERALAHDCARMELDVNEENEAALALYRDLGFTERAKPGAPRDLYMRMHL
jgi:GNAT superfamily N-acetyltransferase